MEIYDPHRIEGLNELAKELARVAFSDGAQGILNVLSTKYEIVRAIDPDYSEVVAFDLSDI